MPKKKKALSFAWWNLHNFAKNYDATRTLAAAAAHLKRDYNNKQDRVVAALDSAFTGDFPDLLDLRNHAKLRDQPDESMPKYECDLFC